MSAKVELALPVTEVSSPIVIEALPRVSAIDLIDAHLAGVAALPALLRQAL